MSAIADAAAGAPAGAGVYFFLDRQRELIYVGKAGNVRRRLQQHAKAARERTTPRDALRAELVAHVRWEACPDEAAAASREADLVVAFRPLLNGALATDGRWVYIAVTTDPTSGTVRFRLIDSRDARATRMYGCFPHLGVGVSSRRAIACSEGYTAALRLLWAACEQDTAARHPPAVAGPSPPRDVTLPFTPGLEPALHRLLSGTSARLLDRLLDHAAETRPAFMLPALRRDHTTAGAFFAHGPRALRLLRLRHHRPAGPLSRGTIESLLLAELRDVLGGFELPAVDDANGALVGARHARALATRAVRRRRQRDHAADHHQVDRAQLFTELLDGIDDRP